MVAEIKDPLLLGSLATSHIGGIITVLGMIYFSYTFVAIIILIFLLAVDILVLFRSAQANTESQLKRKIKGL